MKISSKKLVRKMGKEIGKYKFEVGVLKDSAKKIPNRKRTSNYAGTTLSATKGSSNKQSLAETAKYTDKFYGWLKKPFKESKNKDVLLVVKELSSQVFSKASANNKRLENAVQAVIRNPILRGDYGNNSKDAIKRKGFDKLLMDTGQLFKNIKAKRL